MKNMQKSIQKAFLLAGAISALDTQAIFASEVGGEIASKIALADNERERESSSRAICTSGF